MQLGRLAGLGEILLAVGQGCLAGRGEAGPGGAPVGSWWRPLRKVCSFYPPSHPFRWKREECCGRQLCT